MSMSIEDILRGHGIGSGGGLQIVKSETEPTTGLGEGLLWYKPSNGLTQMYLDGQFKSIGGGGSLITPFFGRATTTSITSTLAIPVGNYNATSDVLLVSQNGTNVTESIDFRINKELKTIEKITGSWDNSTVFDFTVLALTMTSAVADNVTLVQIEDHVSVVSGISQITFSTPGFNPLFDVLRVHQRNLEIFKGVDWTLHPNGSSITLNYTLEQPEEFHFTVLKKVRDQAPGATFDGVFLLDNSISENKLGVGYQNFKNDFSNHSSDEDIHVTAEDKAGWDAKETAKSVISKIEQFNLKVVRSGKDVEGIFTIVEQKRGDNTLVTRSTLSGGTSPKYTSRTINYYDADGTTILSTISRTLTYDVDGDLESEV
jgi:hypothetical protein